MLRSHDLSCLSVSGRLTSHDLSCLSVSGGLPECSEVTICRACRCLEALGGSKCRILRVWKLKTSINTSHLLDFRHQEVPTLTTLRDRVGPLKKTLTRGISILGEIWELGELWARCGSSGSWNRRSGRGLGALGAGFVVPGEVWEGQTLTALSQLSSAGGSPKEPLTRGISTLGELWELGELWARCGSSESWIRR